MNTSAGPAPAGPRRSSLAGALGIVPPRGRPGVLATVLVVTARWLRKFLRTPQHMAIGTVQGALFLLIFRYVFGGAIDTGPVPYVDYMVPGFVVSGVLFSGAGFAAGVAEDVEQGFFDRQRSLPVARHALLTGQAVANTVLLTWSLAISCAIGFVVGFRLHGSITQGLAAFGLAVAFGFAWTWLFILMGQVAGNAQSAQGMSMLVFPFTFVSSAYVPVESMPGWMQSFAENQPVTAMVNASRSLALGDPGRAGLEHTTVYWVMLALVWSVGLVLMFAPLAILRYRRV